MLLNNNKCLRLVLPFLSSVLKLFFATSANAPIPKPTASPARSLNSHSKCSCKQTRYNELENKLDHYLKPQYNTSTQNVKLKSVIDRMWQTDTSHFWLNYLQGVNIVALSNITPDHPVTATTVRVVLVGIFHKSIHNHVV